MDGETVRQLSGELFSSPKETAARHRLSEVKLLYPLAAQSKILALAGNYRNHLGGVDPRTAPEPFYRTPSCMQNPEDQIVIDRQKSDPRRQDPSED